MKTNLAYSIKHSSIGILSSILSNRQKINLEENNSKKDCNKRISLLGKKYKVTSSKDRE